MQYFFDTPEKQAPIAPYVRGKKNPQFVNPNLQSSLQDVINYDDGAKKNMFQTSYRESSAASSRKGSVYGDKEVINRPMSARNNERKDFAFGNQPPPKNPTERMAPKDQSERYNMEARTPPQYNKNGYQAQLEYPSPQPSKHNFMPSLPVPPLIYQPNTSRGMEGGSQRYANKAYVPLTEAMIQKEDVNENDLICNNCLNDEVINDKRNNKRIEKVNEDMRDRKEMNDMMSRAQENNERERRLREEKLNQSEKKTAMAAKANRDMAVPRALQYHANEDIAGGGSIINNFERDHKLQEYLEKDKQRDMLREKMMTTLSQKAHNNPRQQYEDANKANSFAIGEYSAREHEARIKNYANDLKHQIYNNSAQKLNKSNAERYSVPEEQDNFMNHMGHEGDERSNQIKKMLKESLAAEAFKKSMAKKQEMREKLQQQENFEKTNQLMREQQRQQETDKKKQSQYMAAVLNEQIKEKEMQKIREKQEDMAYNQPMVIGERDKMFDYSKTKGLASSRDNPFQTGKCSHGKLYFCSVCHKQYPISQLNKRVNI